MRFLIILLISSTGFAQEEYDVLDHSFGMLVRGKVIVGPTGPENLSGRMYTIGGEFRFAKRHAIGVDWVDFKNNYGYESLDTVSGYYNNNGTFHVMNRRYGLIGYRYYFGPIKDRYPFFINALVKLGNQNEWFWDGTEDTKHGPYSSSTIFKEFGLGIGSHIPFYRGRMGLDLSLGVIFAMNRVRYGNYHQTAVPTSTPVASYVNLFKPHMRLNLYFNLFKI